MVWLRAQLAGIWSVGAIAVSLSVPAPILGAQQDATIAPSLQVTVGQHEVGLEIKSPLPQPTVPVSLREEAGSIAWQPRSSVSLNLPSLLRHPRSHPIVTSVGSQTPATPAQVKASAPESIQPPPGETKRVASTVGSAIGIPKLIIPVGGASNDVDGRSSPYDLLDGLPIGSEPRPSALAKVPSEKSATEPLPAKKESAPTKPKPVVGTANHITVPSVGIDIAVQAGSYDSATNSWQVDDTSAFLADTTVPVNDTNGTTLIYGHARWGIFGNLPDTKAGAEATVSTVEGLRFVYVFESIREVDPSDVSMLTVEGPPKLILQTCSGLLDQHRTLATFRLKEVVQDQV